MHAVERRREAGVRDQALPSAIVRIEGIITHLAMRVPSARRPSSMAAPGSGDSLRRVLGNRLLIRQGFVLERGWMRHGNDVVAGIHEVNVTGDSAREIRKQVERGATDFYQRHASAQWRVPLLKGKHLPRIGNAGAGQPADWASRDGG